VAGMRAALEVAKQELAARQAKPEERSPTVDETLREVCLYLRDRYGWQSQGAFAALRLEVALRLKAHGVPTDHGAARELTALANVCGWQYVERVSMETGRRTTEVWL
jgi:hypothetical protein